MQPSAESMRLARRLAALPELPMRQRVLQEHVERTPPQQVVRELNHIVHFGRQGGPPFNIALLTVSATLSSGQLGYDTMSKLYGAAKEAGLEAVTDLMLSNAPGQVIFSRREEQLELTLGHRKSRARSTDRDTLDRLLASPEPEVVHILLQNPRLTEKDVVLLAARRPAYAEIQQEIFAATRWIRRYSVKRALVLNPYTPSSISQRLLGFLNRADLKLIEGSPNLPLPLRQAANRLRSQPGPTTTDDKPGPITTDDEPGPITTDDEPGPITTDDEPGPADDET